ncbi:tripartite tricarboxylate transporter TctB family protein [Aurantimonas sp. Leaf443]|uniref:tripartite tricarboxylate transporter TctB family protein n=1 Tax=Aurantimonas sp. Leaf443 TaxID=1736378 RepID=UPI0006F8429B|nr:tripartite tricarboxylate transporter TctB family protein [Aurantimonas sp. Leaf443]KQT87996.1 hypothetical protein ASG48_00615 [Aurantimonas sp. Leaf443]
MSGPIANGTAEVGVRSRRDMIAGAIFILVALAFGLEASRYQIGTAFRMGPGFWPLVLAVFLALFGGLVLLSGLKSHERIEPTPIPWKGIGLVCLAILIFGEFGRVLGLLPTVFLCTAIVSLASVHNRIVDALMIALAMSVLCWLVFKLGLGITLPSFGPLFSF